MHKALAIRQQKARLPYGGRAFSMPYGSFPRVLCITNSDASARQLNLFLHKKAQSVQVFIAHLQTFVQ